MSRGRVLLLSLLFAAAPALAQDPAVGGTMRDAPARNEAPADAAATEAHRVESRAFEQAQFDRLLAARRRMERADAEGALGEYDTVLAAYRARYPADGRRRYDVRSPEEALAVLAMAANDGGPADALYVHWSDAHYMKAYALVELARLDEAAVELGHALALAPMNSQYHAELGHVFQERRDWNAALRHYIAATDHAAFSPANDEDGDRARGLRGQGFVLIELGRLDEAERRLREAMRFDAADTIAPNELRYIEQLRAKRGD
ncbi:hypothetical protein [Lysobacter humi (ex Lee et al. 2017)]